MSVYIFFSSVDNVATDSHTVQCQSLPQSIVRLCQLVQGSLSRLHSLLIFHLCTGGMVVRVWFIFLRCTRWFEGNAWLIFFLCCVRWFEGGNHQSIKKQKILQPLITVWARSAWVKHFFCQVIMMTVLFLKRRDRGIWFWWNSCYYR
jgi:hypothetical protein